MRREKGKVPTNINKDMVAKGPVQTQKQIRTEGSLIPKNSAAVIARIKDGGTKGKSALDLELEALRKGKVQINPERFQKPKEFTKRIEHERGKDK